jgi:hypothetical protein
VGFDRVALIVDPAVRTRLFDHGGEILLPTGILLEAGPLAQRSLENPGRLCIGEFRLARHRAPHRIEPAAIALDDKLEGAKVLPVLELQFAGRRQLQKHDPPFRA